MYKVKLALTIIAITSLVACGSKGTDAVGTGISTEIDPDFIKYQQIFNNEAAARGLGINANSVSVVYDNDNTMIRDPSNPSLRMVSECFADNGEKVKGSKIVVHGLIFNTFSEVQKEATILHEYGHCVLGRDHRNDGIINKNVNGIIPNSLMNMEIYGQYYFFNKKYYLDELFSETPSSLSISDSNFTFISQLQDTQHSTVGKEIKVQISMFSRDIGDYFLTEFGNISIVSALSWSNETEIDFSSKNIVISASSLVFNAPGSYIITFMSELEPVKIRLQFNIES